MVVVGISAKRKPPLFTTLAQPPSVRFKCPLPLRIKTLFLFFIFFCCWCVCLEVKLLLLLTSQSLKKEKKKKKRSLSRIISFQASSSQVSAIISDLHVSSQRPLEPSLLVPIDLINWWRLRGKKKLLSCQVTFSWACNDATFSNRLF